MQRSQLRKFFFWIHLYLSLTTFFLMHTKWRHVGVSLLDVFRKKNMSTTKTDKKTMQSKQTDKRRNQTHKQTNRQINKETKRRRNQERQSNAIWLTNELKNLTRQDDEGEYWKLQGRIHSSTKLQHLSSDSIELN